MIPAEIVTDPTDPDVVARCLDGTYTTSSGQGACSSHGGVDANWSPGDPDPAATATSSATASPAQLPVTGSEYSPVPLMLAGAFVLLLGVLALLWGSQSAYRRRH